MLLPTLSELDPPLTSEGSLDPLGLYPIADSLGVRLSPDVRERQAFPRFLTAMAVSAAICEPFDENEVAADDVSSPRQVFEWYAVEGLVRSAGDSDSIRGLPGREKARAAITDGVTLSADRYLKSPSVFGFHGVYRLLARTLGLEIGDRLGESGADLVATWADEQNLPGFVGSNRGAGADWRARLRQAVKNGLECGHVARKGGWQGWNFFRDHLAPHEIGNAEAVWIRNSLLGSDDGYRAITLNHLVTPQGREVWAATESERAFHEILIMREQGELQDLLRAIMHYESFARLMQDAFDDCRLMMTDALGKVRPHELAELESVMLAASQLPTLAVSLQEQLEPFSEAVRFHEAFVWTVEPAKPLDWVVRLFDHHRLNQQRKPPAGKAPWVEQLDDGSYLIRAAYRVNEGGRHDDSYVHAYRTRPLWSFATELGMVS